MEIYQVEIYCDDLWISSSDKYGIYSIPVDNAVQYIMYKNPDFIWSYHGIPYPILLNCHTGMN